MRQTESSIDEDKPNRALRIPEDIFERGTGTEGVTDDNGAASTLGRHHSIDAGSLLKTGVAAPPLGVTKGRKIRNDGSVAIIFQSGRRPPPKFAPGGRAVKENDRNAVDRPRVHDEHASATTLDEFAVSGRRGGGDFRFPKVRGQSQRAQPHDNAANKNKERDD